jgi:hypothetical protein
MGHRRHNNSELLERRMRSFNPKDARDALELLDMCVKALQDKGASTREKALAALASALEEGPGAARRARQPVLPPLRALRRLHQGRVAQGGAPRLPRHRPPRGHPPRRGSWPKRSRDSRVRSTARTTRRRSSSPRSTASPPSPSRARGARRTWSGRSRRSGI